jgi:tetratricopeptide (TPR) repeat protein
MTARTPGRTAPALLALLLAGTATARATPPESLFEQANQAYERGNFEEAAAGYATLAGYKVHDPRVQFNLANAHFKMGRLGPAVLHYERALRLDPSDREIRENLELARALIHDRVAAPELPYPVAIVTGWLERRSVDLITVLFLGLYLITGGLLGVLALRRGGAGRRLLGYAAAAAGIATAIAGAALVHRIETATAPAAIVMEDRADVLSGPADDNTVLFTVHEGTRLLVRSVRDGWHQVSLPNGLSGWIRAGDVETV